MAIIVEEQKRGSGLLMAALWLFFVVLIGAAIFYVFVINPEATEVKAPQTFQEIELISQIDLNAVNPVGTDAFTSLVSHIDTPASTGTGRPNPFLGF